MALTKCLQIQLLETSSLTDNTVLIKRVVFHTKRLSILILGIMYPTLATFICGFWIFFKYFKSTQETCAHGISSFTTLYLGLFFIGPQAEFLWVSGLCKHALRKWLFKVGIIVHPKLYNPAKIIDHLCLEATMAIQYSSVAKDKKVASSSFPNFLTIDANGNAKICNIITFAVYIDLETKCIVETKLDDVVLLTADEALILCWFDRTASNHVKLDGA